MRFYSPESLPEYGDVCHMLAGIDRLFLQCPPPFVLKVEEDFKVWADYITEQLDRPCNVIREESFGYFFAWRCRQRARESSNTLRAVVASVHYAAKAAADMTYAAAHRLLTENNHGS